jgi:alkaline phosphatase D
MKPSPPLPRREFLLGSLASCALASCARSCNAPAAITSDSSRPLVPLGAQTGDPTARSVVVWSKTDRPARLFVEWATDESFRNARRVEGPIASKSADFSARVELGALPPGRRIHYRVVFEADEPGRARSEPVSGTFRAPPGDGEDVTIVWSGDTVGQGWGIDPARGGMKTYGTIAALEPDVFIHSGDRIYADNPLPERIELPDGSSWKNIVTPAKSKVAETLDEFRGNYAYNFLDDHVKRLAARVPTIVQWDDHEVRNNWFPGQIIEDGRYQERRASVLATYARRAMLECSPMRQGPIHRALSFGPHVDIFVLDARSFRNPNGKNREEGGAAMLGEEQLSWLRGELASSKATWKILACDMSVGLVITDDGTTQEAFANGDGPPLGRETELAALLSFIKDKRIRNVLWVTADVHYAAAHHYDPARAKYTNFAPFWEFVAGPLHAGTFGPNGLDPTFGPEVRFTNTGGPEWKQNAPPSPANQSFGVLRVDGKTKRMRVALCDGGGKELWSMEMDAEV